MSQKSCTNCTKNFTIDENEQVLRQKLQVPEPTFCPQCRLQRRLTWRNEQTLYSRACDLCKKSIISIYATDAVHPVYCSPCWWSDAWDPKTHGQDFDFDKPFFEQFYELMQKVPRPALICEKSENCTYSHNTSSSKNCYLCFSCFHCEDSYYNYMIKDCKDAVDNTGVLNSELSYECINCRGCYNGNYLQDCENCIDSSFCYDSRSLKNCFGCVNLEHKEYHIFNEPVTKEYYENFIKQMESHDTLQELQKKFETFKSTQTLRPFKNTGSQDSTGNHILFSKNAQECFSVENCEDVKYCIYTNDLKDSLDVFGALMGGELQYETGGAGASINTKYACMSWHNSDSAYLNYCNTCSDVFGCIGLRHAKYCVLNKQYTKEEYEKLVAKITAHMQKTGQHGEFFPSSLSPYGYNETKAQDFFPLTREQALQKGFRWKEMQETPVNSQSPICTNCGKNFKCIPQELNFYERKKLPIPRSCPDCRYKQRLARAGGF